MLDSRKAPDRALTGRASVFVAVRDVNEIALIKQSSRFVIGGKWFGNQCGNAVLLTIEDLLAIEVTAVGKYGEVGIANRLPCLLGHGTELLPVVSAVGHIVGHDQMMLRIHGNLGVIADDAGATAAGGHGTGVGVCERDLMIRRSLHLFFDATDLLLESRHAAFAHSGRFPVGTIELGQVAPHALLKLLHASL